MKPLTSRERAARAHIDRTLHVESGYHRIARLARPWRWLASDLPALMWVGAALLLALALLSSSGCASPDQAEPPAAPLPPEESMCENDDDDTEGYLLALDASHCTGHWIDPTDSSTRLAAHPDTGLCTFACVWQEKKCAEPWYGDVRCFPAHAAQLGALCASLGGRCVRAQADGLPYCEAL